MNDLARADVIAPSFKRRLSGVTSTVVRLVPLQAHHIGILASGFNLPPEVPQVAPWRLVTMSRTGPCGPRVWHARRNSEMLSGLLLKHVLRKKLKLLFTSASQRHHTGYTKWLIRRMDAVIATSEKTASYLEVPATVIHHGIDTDRFSPVSNRSELRAALGLPETGPLIGCFGRIRAQKGADIFVIAMIDVLSRHPDAHAILLGGVTRQHAEFLEDLKTRIAAAGLQRRLLILPEVPVWEVGRYFQALDIYIAPQRWEGFGLTPLEAMACAVPVVASRVGAFEELVADGETGRLVEIGDVDAIAAATDALLLDSDMRARWAKAARDRAATHFRIEDEAAAIIEVYRRLLATP